MLKEYIEWGAGIIAVLALFIKIPKVEVNVYGWLLRKLGNALNGEVLKRLDAVEKALAEHERLEGQKDARNSRQRILRFNDEVLQGVKHSKEHFDDVLSDIDTYEDYCEAHPDYPNNRAVMAIENIKKIYQKRLTERDFL